MTHILDPEDRSLEDLGWSAHYADQVTAEEADLNPMRIATVHRARMSTEATFGPVKLVLPHNTNTSDFAVGDWVLAEPETHRLVRRLDRLSLLQRRTEGAKFQQLIAANVDTLFIATSCNDDFNLARLERYLALTNEAGVRAVIVLTKADQADDIAPFIAQASGLQRDLAVVSVNAREASAADVLAPWCGLGQTVALIGSSGVGKSTLLNTLTGKSGEEAQATGAIRESDAKGRHTTTSRSLHRIAGRGWVIDTPGMRTLHLSDITEGLDQLFAEITELAPQCKFRDCTHAHEPGCAVQAAIKAGTVDPDRLDRWRKLLDENASNTPQQSGPKGNKIPKVTGRRR